MQITFNDGRKRVSFSMTTTRSAPASRMERVNSPGPK
jgi:hypothetical protein